MLLHKTGPVRKCLPFSFTPASFTDCYAPFTDAPQLLAENTVV